MNSKNPLDSNGSRLPSKALARLMAMAVLACMHLGCASTGVAHRADGGPADVPLRADGSPGLQRCSDEALNAMRILRLQPDIGAWIELDPYQIDESPITLTDGPLESLLDEELVTLPVGTRLYGHVWTGGPVVVIRYYEAQPPNSERVPICGVVRWGPQDVNGKKLPGSPPGGALLKYSRASMWIVRKFR